MAKLDLSVYRRASYGAPPALTKAKRVPTLLYAVVGFIVGFAIAVIATATHAERLALEHTGFPPTYAPYTGGFIGVALASIASVFAHLRHAITSASPQSDAAPTKSQGVFLGYSMGEFTKLGHGRGILKDTPVTLGFNSLTFNIIAIGGTGSGKTTLVVNPILAQLLDLGCGGLVLDIKGDYGDTVRAISTESGKEVVEVGIGAEPFNLIEGLTPDMAASFIRSVLIASGPTKESFFNNAATELVRNALGLIRAVGPERYNLYELYRFIFVNSQGFLEVAGARLSAMTNETEKQRLESYIEYFTRVIASYDDRTLQNIKATIALVLTPFNSPELRAAFCTGAGRSMDEIVTKGSVWLMRLPLAVYGDGARLAYTLIKLRFFNLMQRRATSQELNNGRYAFFVCDEYQEIASASYQGLSDLNFWDKSRSSKCIGLISTQSVSSFRAAIGDATLADTVLQNFRQKLILRSEDSATLRYVCDLLGKVERERESTSAGPQGSSTTTSIHVEEMLTPQYFRNLQGVIALLQIDGHSYDDVLNPIPLYV